MNNFSAMGRIGKDAVVRHTASGEPVAGWSLAVDSGYGEKKQTLWIDCSLWGKRAESLSEYIRKGAQLGVTGELGTREHENKTYLTLRVANVTLVGKREDGEKQHSSRQAPAPDNFDDDRPPF